MEIEIPGFALSVRARLWHFHQRGGNAGLQQEQTKLPTPHYKAALGQDSFWVPELFREARTTWQQDYKVL